jgi:hypothetical protein
LSTVSETSVTKDTFSSGGGRKDSSQRIPAAVRRTEKLSIWRRKLKIAALLVRIPPLAMWKSHGVAAGEKLSSTRSKPREI